MIVEALRALYDLAPKCDVCEEHRATREPATRIACRWRDLPHAAALRAANAAHEAGR